jgi:hypothetical protein
MQTTYVQLLLQQLPGHHHALDLVGALVDLGDRGSSGSSQVDDMMGGRLAARIQHAAPAGQSAHLRIREAIK